MRLTTEPGVAWSGGSGYARGPLLPPGASRRAVGGAFAVALVGLVVAVSFEGLLRWVSTAAVLAA